MNLATCKNSLQVHFRKRKLNLKRNVQKMHIGNYY